MYIIIMVMQVLLHWIRSIHVTVQPGDYLYSQNRENKKSFGETYPPKDFFKLILVI